MSRVYLDNYNKVEGGVRDVTLAELDGYRDCLEAGRDQGLGSKALVSMLRQKHGVICSLRSMRSWVEREERAGAIRAPRRAEAETSGLGRLGS